MKTQRKSRKTRSNIAVGLMLITFGITQIVNAQSEFLPTNYDEPYRGQYHFSQQSGWMNDINGMWYQDGVYHLTYQSFVPSLYGDPSGFALRDWGRAVSTDMIHWEQTSNILVSEDNVPGECWSGSTIIDFNNRSGFGTIDNPAIISFYTAAKRNPGGISGTCIAYSIDKGETWVAYSGNPINISSTSYIDRDPKVFWHEESGKWCCVTFEDQGKFTFYNSTDLKHWNKTSQIHWGHECPDFFELPIDGGSTKKYVLLQGDGDYFIGDFDGSTFTPDAGGPHEMVHNKGFGGSFYASQTFFPQNFPGNRIVQIAWMLGNAPGTTAPWTHNATFPCELKLKTLDEGVRIIRNPIAEIENIHGETQTWTNKTLQSGQNLFTDVLSKSFDLEIVLDLSDTKATNVVFQFADKPFCYNISDESLFGYDLKAKNNQVKIRFLVDWGGMEIFGNDGEYSYVENYRFNPEDYLIAMIPNGEIKVVSATLKELKRIWNGKANNTYINNSDSRNIYQGDWTYAPNDPGYYEYDCQIARATNCSVEFTFTGTQISWYGLKNDDLGMASVYIDGELIESDIDCYSTVRIVQNLFTKTDLTDGVHTIKVVANGNKHPDSRGIALVHDYFGFLGEPGTATSTPGSFIDNSSERITYTGEWVSLTREGMYFNGTCCFNRTNIASMELTFQGTSIAWYALQNDDLGHVKISIDGEVVADNIDCYSTDRRVRLFFEKKDLSEGTHTIKIETKGTKHPNSKGYALVNDYFVVSPSDNGGLSLEDMTLSKDITLYPNPVEDKLFVSGKGLEEIEVFNIEGERVIKKAVCNNTIAELDVSHIKSGVFIVKITKENKEAFSTKLIKH